MSNPFVLTWKDLAVTVRTKQTFWGNEVERHLILNRVSGEAESHSIVAIMGPSGAGKTTLLSALSGRTKREGRIYLNGCSLTNENIVNVSGFLQQHFIATESLTVSEYINFMGALKLNASKKERMAIIEHLMHEFKMNSCADSQLRYLSGGEKKIVGLAVELMGNPPILFCDEPTTGLDSFNAICIMQRLKAIADSGKIVVASVHQPSSQIYSYFTDVIMLCDGHLLVQGTCKKIDEFFDSSGLPCPKSYNPAEFYIKQVALKSEELRRRCQEETQTITETSPFVTIPNVQRKRMQSVWSQLFWLIWRSIKSTQRDIPSHIGHTLILMITATIVATAYCSVTQDGNNTVQNFKGLTFFIISELVFTHLYSVINTFPEELAVFRREEGIYFSFPYYMSKIIVTIPKCFLSPLLFLIIVFMQVDFPTNLYNFLEIHLVLSIGCVSATALGLCLSATFQSKEYIELFIMPFDLLSMLMAGILVNVSTLPVYFIWLKYTSPFFYTYESVSIIYWKSYWNPECQNSTTVPCYFSGEQVLDELGFSTAYADAFWNVLDLCALSVIFCLIGYLGITRKSQ